MSTTDPAVLRWLEAIEAPPATLLETRAEFSGTRRLRVDVAEHPLRRTFTRPGQFVAMGTPAVGKRFFAVASDPRSSGVAEFLIGGGQAIADALLELNAGDELLVSAALGDGYPVDRDGEFVVVGSGTGFASLRPAVDALIGAAREVSVWVGGRAGEPFPFDDSLQQWANGGVRVTRTTGFVNEALAPELDALRSDDHGLARLAQMRWLVCGSEAMQNAVLATLQQAGVERERVHFNW